MKFRPFKTIGEAQAFLAMNTIALKHLFATCKHDGGVRIYKGEEVCAICAICPIPD